MPYTHYDRLSALDATFLELESPGVHMHVGSVGIFEPGPLATEDGGIDFDQVLKLSLIADSHLIVVAVGENHDLKTGFGSSHQANLQPIAYNNPIFVDVDGGGFQPNGDTLGFELPVAGRKVDVVKGKLGVE